MLESQNGKLLVYAPNFKSRNARIKTVGMAAEKMARFLNLDVEFMTFREKLESIYVYYKNGDDEPIPVYRDKDEKSSIQDVCTALRNMMFVLSFHPKHSALKEIRKEIMRFS